MTSVQHSKVNPDKNDIINKTYYVVYIIFIDKMINNHMITQYFMFPMFLLEVFLVFY